MFGSFVEHKLRKWSEPLGLWNEEKRPFLQSPQVIFLLLYKKHLSLDVLKMIIYTIISCSGLIHRSISVLTVFPCGKSLTGPMLLHEETGMHQGM